MFKTFLPSTGEPEEIAEELSLLANKIIRND